jgi:hypothetical protein
MSMQSLLIGGVAGAGLMYLFDPVAGRRRRSLLRDKLLRSRRLVQQELDVEMRDTANRARGLFARLRTAFDRRQPDDEVIAERVRAALGRSVAHAVAIRASVRDAVVRLDGPVLAAEADRVRRVVRRVRGVRHLDDRLQIHEQPDVPSLQGDVPRRPLLRLVPAGRLALGAVSAVTLIAIRPRPQTPRGWFSI